MDRLVGGIGTLRDKKPEKTVGSYLALRDDRFSTMCIAPCLSTRRSRLTPDEVYAVSAYVLFLNGIVSAGHDARRGQRSPRSRCRTATDS